MTRIFLLTAILVTLVACHEGVLHLVAPIPPLPSVAPRIAPPTPTLPSVSPDMSPEDSLLPTVTPTPERD